MFQEKHGHFDKVELPFHSVMAENSAGVDVTVLSIPAIEIPHEEIENLEAQIANVFECLKPADIQEVIELCIETSRFRFIASHMREFVPAKRS